MSWETAAIPSVIDQKPSRRRKFNCFAEGKAYAILRSMARIRMPLGSL
jgi:hypothetical protein